MKAASSLPVMLVLVILLLAGCAPASTQPGASSLPTQIPLTSTETAPQYGTEENPIVWVLSLAQDNEVVFAGAIDIAAAIKESSGLVVTVEYADKGAWCDHEAQMIALDALDYLVAHEQGCAEAALVSIRNNSTFLEAPIFTEADFPSVFEKLNKIARSTPVPNAAIAFSPQLPDDLREAVVTALLSLNETEEGLADLNVVYGWSGLEAIDDSFYNDLRQQLEKVGVSLGDLDN